MAITAKPYVFSAGAVIIASEHNSNFDALFNLVNGTLDTTNLSTSAAIVDTQLAQITTASKVSGTAITGLASVPSGAGLLPVANVDTGTTANKIVILNGSAQLPAVDGSLLTGIAAGFTAVQTGTPTTVTSFTVSSLVSGARYRLFFNFVQNTSNGIVTLRFNADSGSNYKYATHWAGVGGTAAQGGSASDTSITLSYPAQSLKAAGTMNGYFDFVASAASVNTAMLNGLSFSQNTGDSIWYTSHFGGVYSGAAAISSLVMATSAGTFTGAWQLYRFS